MKKRSKLGSAPSYRVTPGAASLHTPVHYAERDDGEHQDGKEGAEECDVAPARGLGCGLRGIGSGLVDQAAKRADDRLRFRES